MPLGPCVFAVADSQTDASPTPEERPRGGDRGRRGTEEEEPGAGAQRLLSLTTVSPLLSPKSAFRPIWDDPTKQLDSAPERDSRQGFVPIQAPRPSFHLFNTHRENLRQSLLHREERPPVDTRVTDSGASVWDSDSEGPCSTV
ncbi:hypothetical protein WMY93_017757 [Mugilogobius chulae]|uniref:Uncharacterized protein n=1 Tax=Mugilogobius chulae TaxID=88201 RepID=A0AAW0NTU1_9GOBI